MKPKRIIHTNSTPENRRDEVRYAYEIRLYEIAQANQTIDSAVRYQFGDQQPPAKSKPLNEQSTASNSTLAVSNVVGRMDRQERIENVAGGYVQAQHLFNAQDAVRRSFEPQGEN